MTRSEYDKQYYTENRERIITRKRNYYKNNKDAALKKSKEHYKENADKKRLDSRLYFSKNKDKIRKYKSSPDGKFVIYKTNARAKGREFLLSKEEFIEIICKPCSYCGIEKSNGIDRVNSKVGYTLSNSVPCCWRCNIMKRELSVPDFLEHIQKIYIRIMDGVV